MTVLAEEVQLEMERTSMPLFTFCQVQQHATQCTATAPFTTDADCFVPVSTSGTAAATMTSLNSIVLLASQNATRKSLGYTYNKRKLDNGADSKF